MSWWFSTEEQERANILKSAGLFLVFRPISTMLLFRWSPLVLLFPCPPVSVTILWWQYRALQLQLGEWKPASRKSRREQVVISRLRIGHTRLTHTFILKQEPQLQCLTCQTTCTVKHILKESRTFAVIRKRFFKVNNLTDLFENVKIDDFLSFLRETGLYQKILQLKTG